MAAWRRFTVCLSALPENEAASILSAVQNEIIARACTRDAIEPRRDQVFFALLPMRFPSSFSGKQFYVNHLISFGFHRAALHSADWNLPSGYARKISDLSQIIFPENRPGKILGRCVKGCLSFAHAGAVCMVCDRRDLGRQGAPERWRGA